MKIWEIAKGMSENKYSNGQIFQNEHLGDMTIEEDVLVTCDEYGFSIGICLDDKSEWEAL